MKKLLTLMIAAAAMISFTACEKENNEKVLPNEFTIGMDTYALGAAICNCYVYDNQEMTEYNIWLTDKVHWDANGDWEDVNATNYSNSFETNVYDLYAKGVAEGSMPTGKFTYSLNDEHLTHNGYSDYLVYDENGDYDEYIEFGQYNVESSKLEIEIKHICNNIYELKLTGGVDVFGNAVSGYYKGAFDIHVYHEADLK